MTEMEIISEFKYRYLNEKTNNYIFCQLEDFKVIQKIPDRCSIEEALDEIDIEYAQNIKINLKEINVKDILTYTLQLLKKLSLLDSTLDYTLEFNNKFDLLKFQNILRNYGIVVQLIFYNLEDLELKEQLLFNEIYYFNSIFFNANSFIKDNNFQSYFLNDERILDNRENYTKIKAVNYSFIEKVEKMRNPHIRDCVSLGEKYGVIEDYSQYQEKKDLEEYRKFMNCSAYDEIKEEEGLSFQKLLGSELNNECDMTEEKEKQLIKNK
ncbi:MAG: hypothetical protein E7157_00680 [Lactobacillales bacterium]|nr:hypothetical protein [Lactobacillales bacterium]